MCVGQLGGAQVIQRRVSAKINFTKKWIEYERGFGELDGSFWIG